MNRLPMRLFFLVSFLLPSLIFIPAFPAGSSDHLTVRLIPETESIQPGQPVTVGLYFQMEKGWHIYWKNPGDSGQAPQVSWKLPPGFKAGPLQWPVPERIAIPSLMDYGYNGEVLLLSTLHAPKGLKPSQMIRFSAQVHWLVCQESCIPGQARLELRLPVENQKLHSHSKWKDLFEATQKKTPLPQPKDWEIHGLSNAKNFQLDFEADIAATTAFFFPLHPNQIENAAPQEFTSSDKAFHLRLKKSDQLAENIPALEGLLVVTEKGGQDKEYWVKVPLSLGK